MVSPKIEALSACLLCFLLPTLSSVGIFLFLYLAIFTQYWYVTILYYIWVYYIDKETPERGGHRSEWLRSLRLFRYVRDYFPIKLHIVPGGQLDPKKNYMGCIFPHAFSSLAASTVLGTNAFSINEEFPNHTIYGTTISTVFRIPAVREFALAMGLCYASAKAIGYHLGHPEGGKIVGIVVGGASEVFHCHNGQYRLTLKNRKGFIKLSLIHGAPLIPMFVFGETSILKQIVFPKGSLIRAFIQYSKKLIGIPCVIVHGRGLFQERFGLIPFKKPINMVVGCPMDVVQNVNPTQVDIDQLHQQFVDKLTQLFEEYKYKFEKDPTNCKLVIE